MNPEEGTRVNVSGPADVLLDVQVGCFKRVWCKHLRSGFKGPALQVLVLFFPQRFTEGLALFDGSCRCFCVKLKRSPSSNPSQSPA